MPIENLRLRLLSIWWIWQLKVMRLVMLEGGCSWLIKYWGSIWGWILLLRLCWRRLLIWWRLLGSWGIRMRLFLFWIWLGNGKKILLLWL